METRNNSGSGSSLILASSRLLDRAPERKTYFWGPFLPPKYIHVFFSAQTSGFDVWLTRLSHMRSLFEVPLQDTGFISVTQAATVMGAAQTFEGWFVGSLIHASPARSRARLLTYWRFVTGYDALSVCPFLSLRVSPTLLALRKTGKINHAPFVSHEQSTEGTLKLSWGFQQTVADWLQEDWHPGSSSQGAHKINIDSVNFEHKTTLNPHQAAYDQYWWLCHKDIVHLDISGWDLGLKLS